MTHLKFASRIGMLLLFSFLSGAFLAAVAGAPEYAVHTGLAFTAISLVPKGMAMSGQLFNQITAADIVTEFGAYYKNNGQNTKDLIQMMLQQSETEGYFTRIPTTDTRKEKATVQMTKVLQAFQKKWTPKGDITFKPLIQNLFHLKIDLEYYPDELHESWLGFLLSDNLDRKTWPFPRYISKLATDQAKEDYELDEVFKGVYSAPVTDVANPAGENVDGLKKQFDDMHEEGTINTIVMGAMPTDPVDVVNYIETFDKEIRGINKKLHRDIDGYFMEHATVLLFREGMREKYNQHYAQADVARTIDSNKALFGLNSMDGSDRIWASPKANRIQYVKGIQNEDILRVENEDRKLKMYSDFWKSIGIWVPQWAFQNDQDFPEEPEPDPEP